MKRAVAALALAALALACTSPAPTPTPTAPPTPEPTADINAQIDAVTGSVPDVRGLQPTRNVPHEFITREQFQADLREVNDAEVPPDVRAAEERLYKRLGLLPADADMDALIQDLYGAQVLAYYQPEDGHFYVISTGQPFGAADKIVVAHEYTHALQDQHFDLKGNTIKDNSQGDAQLAQLAVIEGDATLTSQLWATDNLSLGDMVQMLIQGFSELDQASLAGVPPILRRQLVFPYSEGLTFVTALHEQGGFDAVNEALATPPPSTEQILHPEKYFAHEAPIAVQAPDLLASLGNGWYQAYEQTLGELGIQIVVAGGETPEVDIPGLPADWPHADVAAGWGGDRLRMYERTDGQWRIEWTSSWDTTADAVSFRSRMNELTPTFDGVSRVVRDDDRVAVTLASDAALLGGI